MDEVERYTIEGPMDATLRLVDKFEELLQRHHDDSPYEFTTIFATGGFWVRRASQKKLTLLKRLDEQLRPILKPQERVRYLTTGVLYSFWESYLLGGLVYYLNQRALVLTTERLLLIQIDAKQRPTKLKSQVLLGDIERLKASGLGNAKLHLRNGHGYVFTRVPRRDRRQLADLLASAVAGASPGSALGAIEELCPFCYAVVPGHPERCASCGGTLKSPAKAARLSLLFPGLGTIYLGYWKLGAFKVFIGALIWLGVWLPDPQNPSTLAGRAPGAVAVLAVVHLISAATSAYMARKGHHPGEAPIGKQYSGTAA